MPDFWQFPTGSMGIGPISAIYQARFMRYLAHRGASRTPANRRVWGVFGDGEMDEPESIGALSLAAREHLDNLTFVINCNLQRLDGPVRGNGQIIQELESLFAGAGWNVIKVLWGSEWDALFARDTQHALLRRLAATVDGEYQNLGAKDGAYNVEHFFKKDPGDPVAGRAHDRRGDRRAQARWPRCCANCMPPSPPREKSPRPAHGHSGQDQEGLRHGRRRRIAHDRAPGEEAGCRCP
jgi:pyruvate dehydrogenase complex dehydrogenase (E1) component